MAKIEKDWIVLAVMFFIALLFGSMGFLAGVGFAGYNQGEQAITNHASP